MSINPIDLDGVLTLAERLARRAGALLLDGLLRPREVHYKGAVDLVTEYDWKSEALIAGELRTAFPDHHIIGEEGGGQGAPVETAPFRWYIDPLDGTTNFTHGYPQFCTSIAYERRGRIQVAVVYDALKKECFVAQRGNGARLNGKPIHVSTTPSLDLALLVTGFPYDRRERRRYYLTFWEAFMMRAQGVRRTGSAALDLSWVACGRVDGFWEFGLKSWDIAAGSLIVEEAGGSVSNMDGSPLGLDAGQIVASNGRLHDQIVATIAAAEPDAQHRQAEIE